jgi:ornithine cyclodeaminase/alanine dehydrogenase-like protein (mu-crystallin family)
MTHLPGPIVIDLPRARASLGFDRLVPALRAAFIAGAQAPLRHRHLLDQPGAATATLLVMPAWQGRSALGVKIVTVFPDNGAVEAGDLTQPLATGVLARADVAGSLFSLCRGEMPGRRTEQEITLFKSVGSALEDLAAAALVWEDQRPGGG